MAVFDKFRTASSEPVPVPVPARAVGAPTAIVDGAELAERLGSLVFEHGPEGGKLRPAMLAQLQEALAAGRTEVRRRFEEGQGSGDDCVAELAFLIDQLIRALATTAVDRLYPMPNPTMGEKLTIVAVGGYGRGELAPQSDIDLLFLLPYKSSARVEQIVETILYMLWDLGLKVGQAVRSVDECVRSAKADITIRTSLLESRALWGENQLYETFRQRFDKEVVAGSGPAFVEAKLAERNERHRRLGDSRYVLEPNIKDGKGGLRDLQTLFWIAKYLYRVDTVAELVERGVLTKREASRFAKAQTFLITLRCHLHFLAGRPEERLTFDVQTEIGGRMGYTDHAGTSGVERFMKHYFLTAKDVGDFTRIFCAALEAESQRPPRRAFGLLGAARKALDGFVVEGGRLNVADPLQFAERPVDMIRLFRLAQERRLDIHPNALKLITRSLKSIDPALRADAEANRLFLEILTSREDPELALRRMNEAGVLGRFIPDFARVVAQMQYDMYHVYTVDEHTLFAVGILHRIDTGRLAEELPLTTRVMAEISSRRALYVAMLLHDIAKGRGGDHSVLGARVARKLCPRFGLDDEETETVEWLVRWHLLMVNFALKRDIEDDKTVQDFVAQVESPERLRLLLLLTTADIRAVGPGRWNGWKATLLRELYHRAKALMTGGFDMAERGRRVEAAQAALREALPDWSAEDVESFVTMGYPPYWLSLDTVTHAHHARLIRDAEREERPLTVVTRIDRGRATTELTVYTADHPGVFSRLAAALAVAGASIADAKIFTMANGMALDVFSIQDATTGGTFDAPEKLARLSVLIDRSLSGRLKLGPELSKRRAAQPSRTRVFRVQPRVMIDNDASRTHTVIEVNGRDRPGLLYDITRALTELSLQISSAKVQTYGERAVDVFYVKDIFGLKISHERTLGQIRDNLLAALTDPDCAARPLPAVRPRRPARRRARVPDKAAAARKPAPAGE